MPNPAAKKNGRIVGIAIAAILVAGALAAAWYFLARKKPEAPPGLPKAPVAEGPLQPTLEMKSLNGRIVPFQNGLPYPAADRQKRPSFSLNGPWRKIRVPGDHKLSLSSRTDATIALLARENPDAVNPSFDDEAWQSHEVPGVENPSPDRYQDVTWYRKTFRPAAAFKGRRALLNFGAVNYVADVWVNGRWVGCHEGGFTPFLFDVTDHLDHGKANLVSVRVDNIPWRPHNDSGGKSGTKANQADIVPYKTADWWNYGGILRDVELEAVEPLALYRADLRASPKLDKTQIDALATIGNRTGKKGSADLRFKVHPAKIDESNLTSPFAKDLAVADKDLPIDGESTMKLDLTGEPFQAATLTFTVPALEPWELRNPQLYVLETQLWKDGRQIESFFTQFGLRSISSRVNQIILNEKPVFWRGVAAHEVFPGEREKMPALDEIIRRDFRNIYDMNANFLRTGHHPPHPLTPLVADRLGIGIWEEIPVYWFDGDAMDFQRTKRPVARQYFLEMIARDINRPSILVWGACNECAAQKERSEFIRDLRESGMKYDPTRLIAQSAAGNDTFDRTHDECDFIGFTSYYGVFYGWNYGDATVKALDALHAAHPNKAIVATEFGIWSESDLSNSDNQIRVAQETYAAFARKPYVAGCIWWALNDWNTMISDPQSMGLVAFDGSKKPAYYAMQELYAGREGSVFLKWRSPSGGVRGIVPVKIDFVTPSPARSVVLELDGKPLRLEKDEGSQTYSCDFDSSSLTEGEHTLFARAENEGGAVLFQRRVITVDNVDELPVLEVNLKPNDEVMDGFMLRIDARDDRGLRKVEIKIDDKPWEKLDPLHPPGTFVRMLDFAGLEPGSRRTVAVRATDTGDQPAESSAAVRLRSPSWKHLSLPFNVDWVSSAKGLADGTGWDYPAEELPASNIPFVFNGKKGPVEFKLGNKADGQKNALECHGQVVKIPDGNYKAIHLLGAMHDGTAPAEFLVTYKEGLPKSALLSFSDWWKGQPRYGDEAVVRTSFHHEKDNETKKPGVGIYLQSIPVPENQQPLSITLPKDKRLRLFAISLEPKVIEPPHP